MAKRPDKSGLERWAGLHFEGVAAEVWAAGERGTRAPEFQAVIDVMRCIADLPDRAGEIQRSAFNVTTAAMWAGLHGQPNLQENRRGTAADLEELHGAHERLVFLWRYFSGMHLGAWEALGKVDSKGLRKFKKDIALWSKRAHEAEKELDKTEHRPSRKGRPKEEIYKTIRSVALREFEILTGRPAARKLPDDGPLADFFEAVFIALGFPAKGATRQARQALEERDAALAKTLL